MSFTDMIAAEQDKTAATSAAKKAAKELDERMRLLLMEQLRPMVDDFNHAKMVFTKTPSGMSSTASVHNRRFEGKPAYLLIEVSCGTPRLQLVCPVPEAMQTSPGNAAKDLDEGDMENIIRDVVCGKTPELLFCPTMSKTLLKVVRSKDGGYVYHVEEGGYGENHVNTYDPAEAAAILAQRVSSYVEAS